MLDVLDHPGEKVEPERRATRRFPVALQLEYKALRHAELIREGVGRTINISSGGVLFEADGPLDRDLRLELSIEWPVYYRKSPRLRLMAFGEIVRVHEKEAAVRIARREFRMGSTEEVAGSDS